MLALAGSAPRLPGETVAAGAAWPPAGDTVIMEVAEATCPVAMVSAGPVSFVAFVVAPAPAEHLIAYLELEDSTDAMGMDLPGAVSNAQPDATFNNDTVMTTFCLCCGKLAETGTF